MAKNARKKPVFCVRFREARQKRGLSLGQLGKILGIAQTHVARIESGNMPRGCDRIVAIADALDVSLDWLFGRT